VTLLATKDSAGASIAPIDGSTWDPFARRLLFTTENANAPIYAVSALGDRLAMAGGAPAE
jgi:hypothetical protein